MILKSFDFQCDFDFDFQITTSKMIWIWILNHLYLGDLILISKSSTYDDFAHLCESVTLNTETIITPLKPRWPQVSPFTGISIHFKKGSSKKFPISVAPMSR